MSDEDGNETKANELKRSLLKGQTYIHGLFSVPLQKQTEDKIKFLL